MSDEILQASAIAIPNVIDAEKEYNYYARDILRYASGKKRSALCDLSKCRGRHHWEISAKSDGIDLVIAYTNGEMQISSNIVDDGDEATAKRMWDVIERYDLEASLCKAEDLANYELHGSLVGSLARDTDRDIDEIEISDIYDATDYRYLNAIERRMACRLWVLPEPMIYTPVETMALFGFYEMPSLNRLLEFSESAARDGEFPAKGIVLRCFEHPEIRFKVDNPLDPALDTCALRIAADEEMKALAEESHDEVLKEGNP